MLELILKSYLNVMDRDQGDNIHIMRLNDILSLSLLHHKSLTYGILSVRVPRVFFFFFFKLRL